MEPSNLKLNYVDILLPNTNKNKQTIEEFLYPDRMTTRKPSLVNIDEKHICPLKFLNRTKIEKTAQFKFYIELIQFQNSNFFKIIN